MSATPSSLQPISPGNANAVPAVPPAEIDASCRAPVLVLFVSAAIWLLIGSALGMIATLKFHSPILLSGHPALTYGRVHPAHLNAWIYGFAAQAGLGVLLWIIAHLGRARLALAPLIITGAILWNVGVTLGILGILLGDSTGFEWLEMPRYASIVLFFGYLAIGLGANATFHQRTERRLYISQWFLLAALYWFPWIYSTANFLLVAKPIRGALQAALDWWYIHNLVTVWFGFIGLGTIFYFIPKITRRPLYSHYLGIFIFWSLALFGSWGGIPPGAPLPAWMPALSEASAILTIVPVIAVALNVLGTLAGRNVNPADNSLFKFILFGAAAYIIASLAGVIASLDRVSEVVNFTWFIPAQMQFAFYGFFAMTMFGAIYYIAPRVAGIGFRAPKLVSLHLWLAALGILLYAVPLALGGIHQGEALNDVSIPFLSVVLSTLPFLRVSTTGDLLMAAGHVVFLLNLLCLLNSLRRSFVGAFLAANAKTVEAAS